MSYPVICGSLSATLIESRRSSILIRAGFCTGLHLRFHPLKHSKTKFFNHNIRKMSEFSTSNALLGDWSHLQYELPPFTELKPGDFEEALKTAMKQHIGTVFCLLVQDCKFVILFLLWYCIPADLKEISESKDLPTFENTIVKFDRSGKLLGRTSALFENLCSSNGVPELQTVELAMAAPLAAHHNQVLNAVDLTMLSFEQ